jgi:hypothetical protein
MADSPVASEPDTSAAQDLVSEFRVPRNRGRNAGAGSIHDDATASRLGFKGGTVAGSIHLDQFVPLLLGTFGDGWFERGNISLYFLQPTVDREPVRARLLRGGGAAQATLSMENERGDAIATGTASCDAADPDTEVRRRLAAMRPAQSLRILAGCSVGDEVADVPTHVTAPVDEALQFMTEPLPAYRGHGPWSGVVVPLSHIIHSGIAVQRELTDRSRIRATGLFGALEVQFHAGPLRAEHDYLGRARIVALTESPKTENLWWEYIYRDRNNGEDVVSVLQYLRFMKASSPLYESA